MEVREVQALQFSDVSLAPTDTQIQTRDTENWESWFCVFDLGGVHGAISLYHQRSEQCRLWGDRLWICREYDRRAVAKVGS
jgi:hypothetical protein